jgi:DNA-binding NarL/FixJ family response regulator
MKLLRVVIVEDDNLIREAFASLVNESERFTCIANYDICEDAIKNLAKDDPQIILMDTGLPGISGIEGIRRIKKLRPQVDIIIMIVNEDDHKIFEALFAGASSYFTKNISPGKLLDGLDEIQSGGATMSSNIARMVAKSFQKRTEVPLSSKETEILQLLRMGKSYSMIVDELATDKETIRVHIKNIYRKLEANSKFEAYKTSNGNG